MKIYLAAMYGKMHDMCRVEGELRDHGHEITARWIHGNEEGMTIPDAAQMDLDDIDAASVVMLFTNEPKTMFSGGGRMVEFGYAVARNKRVIVVGGLENVFCHLRQVEVVEDLTAAIRKLNSWK